MSINQRTQPKAVDAMIELMSETFFIFTKENR